MATKKNSTPANRYLRYELTNSGTPGTETSHYVDLAKDLSAINRRLYRQGRAYHVKRISIVSSNTLPPQPGQTFGRISVSTAQDTWVTRNAWRRGFEIYNKMNKMPMEGIGGNSKPTYHDFKVYLTNDHRTGTVLAPLDNGGNAVQAGEWDYSEYVSLDGTTSADEFFVWLHGDDVGSAGSRTGIGLVKSYSCLLYTSPSPRDRTRSRMPSSA